MALILEHCGQPGHRYGQTEPRKAHFIDFGSLAADIAITCYFEHFGSLAADMARMGFRRLMSSIYFGSLAADMARMSPRRLILSILAAWPQIC